jgi:hypothetical protein
MQKLFLSLAMVFLYCIVQAQLTKGNWMAGGTGSFYSTKKKFSSTISNQTLDALRISLSPSLGYFAAEKFAIGVRPSFMKTKSKLTTIGGLTTNENRFDIGPFARYYFLQADKPFNLIADVSYQYGFYWFTPTKGSRNTFSASAGTVVFFNSSVGLELLLGYFTQKETINDGIGTINEQQGLQMTVGFQFHLEE